MSVATNWRCESASITDPMELMKKHVVLDFRGLASGAVVTNDLTLGNTYKEDSSGSYTMLAGAIFSGAAGDTWRIERTGKGLWPCQPCYLDVDGGTLIWNDNNSGSGDWYPHKEIYKRGTGTVRYLLCPHMPETNYRAQGGTSSFVGNTQPANCAMLLSAGSKLQVESKTLTVATVKADSGAASSSIQIDEGATLHVEGGWNVLSSQSGATFYGDLLGAGTLRITGGVNYVLPMGSKTTAHPFAGTLEPWIGDINLGETGKARGVSSEASVSIPGGGWLRAFEDTSVKTVSGEGVDGGVALPTDKTLTVNGSGATNVYSGRIIAKDFVKTGSDKLTLTGAAGWTGETKVKGGTLRLGNGFYRKNLAAYWNFDNSDDWGEDVSPAGLLSMSIRANPAPGCRPSLVDDGVSGKALHFGDGKSISKTGSFVRAENSDPTSAYALPRDSQSFTFSFWLRPTKGMCGDASNFILVGGKTNVYTNELGNVVNGVNWGKHFTFGFSKFLEDGTYASAGRTICFYCGTGWTRGGVWKDDKSSKPYTNQVALAVFPSTAYLMDGQWHHVVGTYCGTNRAMSIYVDGVLKDRRIRSGNLSLASDIGVQMGAQATNGDTTHNYSGDLDEIQWLHGAWTDEEVLAEYNAKKPQVTTSILPEPVAHWTFSELKKEGGRCYIEDVTGNGFDLEALTTNETMTVDQQVSFVDVTYPETRGKAVFTGSAEGPYFQLKDGVDLSTKIPVGSAFTFSVRRSKALRANFMVFGDLSSSTKNLRLVDDGAPALMYMRAASDTLRGSGVYFKAAASDTSVAYVKCNWVQQTVTYDPEKKYLAMYVDGKRVYFANDVTLAIDPKRLDLMWDPSTHTKNLKGANFDDMRLYDCALEPIQVAELARVVRYDDDTVVQPNLPADSVVTIDAGATLELRPGFVGALKSVSGLGTLSLNGVGQSLSSEALKSFAGTVTGVGSIAVDALSLKLADAGSATPLFNASVPLAIAKTGTVAISGGEEVYGKKWLLAKAGVYTLPDDFSGWKVTQPAGVFDGTVQFVVKDGDLYLKTRSHGTAILLK